jgi:hypothetical protein
MSWLILILLLTKDSRISYIIEVVVRTSNLLSVLTAFFRVFSSRYSALQNILVREVGKARTQKIIRGDAKLTLKGRSFNLNIEKSKDKIQGCMVLISY